MLKDVNVSLSVILYWTFDWLDIEFNSNDESTILFYHFRFSTLHATNLLGTLVLDSWSNSVNEQIGNSGQTTK